MGKASRRKRAKQHDTSLIVDMGERPTSIVEAVYSSDGSVSFHTAEGQVTPADAWVETTYPRAKGPKVVHRLPISAADLTMDPNDALTRYSWVIAVDTNMPLTGESTIAFCGVVQAKVQRESASAFRVPIFRRYVIEIHNPRASPERVGWGLVCSSAANLPPDATVAVVVDSDFSAITAINRREQELAPNLYLPPRFQLIYASADVGTDIPNRLIKMCDRDSRAIARQRAQNTSPPALFQGEPSSPYTHVRLWEVPFESGSG